MSSKIILNKCSPVVFYVSHVTTLECGMFRLIKTVDKNFNCCSYTLLLNIFCYILSIFMICKFYVVNPFFMNLKVSYLVLSVYSNKQIRPEK